MRMLIPDKVHSVSEINAFVRRLLEANFRPLWVEGEISNFKAHSSGHKYFSLKDARCSLRCVMFRSAASRLKFAPRDGMLVRAYGTVGVFEAQGSYQLYVEAMQPAGMGALYQAFEALKAKLQAEGLFRADRKKPLPAFPQRIGVVTSDTGAAIRDIVNVISRRYPLVTLFICPARVQGEGAAESIARGIKTFDRMSGKQRPDVLIVGRGGGSMEDLWAFNTETVARAIAACTIPVISGVGHEIDFTISDFVADKRAPTPSAAAEMAVPDSVELRRYLANAGQHLRKEMIRRIREYSMELDRLASSDLFKPQRLIREQRMRLDALQNSITEVLNIYVFSNRNRLQKLNTRLVLSGPRSGISQARNMLDRLVGRLENSMQRDLQERRTELKRLVQWFAAFRLDEYREKFNILSARFSGFDPRAILKRGYAICLGPAGRIITSYKDVEKNDDVDIELGEGSLECKVKKRRFL